MTQAFGTYPDENEDAPTNGERLLTALEGIRAELRTTNLLAWHQYLEGRLILAVDGSPLVNDTNEAVRREQADVGALIAERLGRA